MVSVLIVDDSKLAGIVVKRAVSALRSEWIQLEAASVEEALSAFGTHQIDLAILDYNMPGGSGLDLAEEVRRRDAQMPIALVTANIQVEIISRARALNVTFVAKPINEEALRGFVSGADLVLGRRAST